MRRYLVTTFRTPDFKTAVVEAHYAFLRELRVEGKLQIAGPFTDQSGGAYLLKAQNLEDAKEIAYRNPVHITGSSIVTVYEWNAE
jgi:uncharacterized protein YciI